MNKTLISWYAFNNDFMHEQKGAATRFLDQVNENGPTFNLHRYFWDEAYTQHIILQRNDETNADKRMILLINSLQEAFPKRTLNAQYLAIDDPINLQEIYSKLSAWLQKVQGPIDIFISPGTPTMQVAWYLLGLNYKDRVSLFQIRSAEFTQSKKTPEKELVSLDSSFFPKQINIIQRSLDYVTNSNAYVISDSIRPVYEMAERIALTNDIGCLILGENGTGKEHLAHFIHNASHRKNKPFMAINCAAFSDELLRSELFGHEKGSFTGADTKKIGLFEAANGGTLFLDEIGDVSPRMQVSLLRVLQNKKVQPIGSNIEKPIDVRVIAATNKNLEYLCDKELFRWDLFYRLAVTSLNLPPLRERGVKEVREMISFFNSAVAERLQKNEQLIFTSEAIHCMQLYDYKGNIRELENLIIQLYLKGKQVIEKSDLPEKVTALNESAITLEESEKRHIANVFKQNQGNILVTAEALGIARDTLKRKLDKFGLRIHKS
jgi:DNA-binding NtrC family response regulator